MQQFAWPVLYRRMRLRWTPLLFASLLAGCPDGTPPPPPETHAPRISVDTTGGLRTTEAGGRARFSIWLTAKPKHAVAIGLHATNDAEGTVNPARVVFTPDNWDQRQPIDVTGVDDSVKDGDQRYAVVLEPAISEDTDYLGLVGPEIDVVNTDDESPAIVATAPKAMTLAEGATATVSLRLTAQPSAPVRLRTAVKGTDVVLDAGEIVFYPTRWNEERALNVRVLDRDRVASPPETIVVAFSPAESDDPLFSGLVVAPLMLDRVDNDTAGFALPARIELREDVSASISIALTSQPTANVIVTLAAPSPPSSTSSPKIVVSTPPLTFTPDNWSTPQSVSLRAERDFRRTNDVTTTLDVVAASTDATYGPRRASIPLTVVDVDPAPQLFLSTFWNLSTHESGDASKRCITVDAKTTTQPLGELWVELSTSDSTEGVPMSTRVRATWEGTSFSVCGVDDTIVDGAQSYRITARVVQTSDPAYPLMAEASLSLTNVDDGELPGDTCGTAITITPGAGASTYATTAMADDYGSCTFSGVDMVFAIPVGERQVVRVDVTAPPSHGTMRLLLREVCGQENACNAVAGDSQTKLSATYENIGAARTIYAIVDGAYSWSTAASITVSATVLQ